ncbi:MAG TPA: tetratricopeptide repeat protein [Phycisphaerae bacterium]|nr:tetratricopeptide repeat protein [Phycisphaerae bacterium]
MTEWDEAEQRVENAHELYERGRWEEALSELQAAIAINPYNGSWYFNLGLTYDAMDRFSEAISAYRRALEIVPEDVEILNAIGYDCNRAGKFDEAIRYFEKVESIDPTFESSYCNRIISYAEKGDHEKAEEMFFMARQYKDRCPLCYYNVGHSLFARGQYDRALWCWQQVTEIEPEHPQVHARIADAYWAKGQLPEARKHFIEELRSNPGDIDIMLDLGELLVEMGDYVAAGEKFRQVLELSPEECTAHFHLGQLAMQDEDFAEALEAFRRVLRNDRTFPGAHLKLAQIYHRRNDHSEALFHANCELAQQTNDEETLLELGNLFMDISQLGSAEVAFNRVLSANPRHAAARHNLAVSLLLEGRTDEGIEHAKAALRIQPKYMLAMHNLAMAYMSKRDFTRAKAWLGEALDIAPDDPQLRQLQSRLRLATFRHAISHFLGRLLRHK